jgi:hypothetical protein
MDNIENKRGLLFIRYHAHNLFCKIYNVQYDRIAIINNDKIWMYWNIPTALSHFVGTMSDVDITGTYITFSAIRPKISEKRIVKAYKTIIDAENDPNIVIENFLKKLGANISDKKIYDAMYDVLCPPKLIYSDKIETNVICTDLLKNIMLYPDSILDVRHRDIKNASKNLIQVFDNLLSNIKNDKRIGKHLLNNLNNAVSEAQKIIQINPVESGISTIDTDKIIIIEVDKTVKRTLRQIKNEFNNIHKGNLQIQDLTKLMNKLLCYFSEDPILFPQIPYSCIVTFHGSNVNTVTTSNDIEIPLSGQGIELLGQEDAEELLKLLKQSDYQDERFNTLRMRIIDQYYKSSL